jgi:hypothetical protein
MSASISKTDIHRTNPVVIVVVGLRNPARGKREM